MSPTLYFFWFIVLVAVTAFSPTCMTTGSKRPHSLMENLVICTIRTYQKIFGSVVRPVLVNMMHYRAFGKWFSKSFLRDLNVLQFSVRENFVSIWSYVSGTVCSPYNRMRVSMFLPSRIVHGTKDVTMARLFASFDGTRRIRDSHATSRRSIGKGRNGALTLLPARSFYTSE